MRLPRNYHDSKSPLNGFYKKFSHFDAKCEIFFRKAIIQKELARARTKVSPFSEGSFSVLFLLYLPKKFGRLILLRIMEGFIYILLWLVTGVIFGVMSIVSWAVTTVENEYKNRSKR